MNTDLLTLKETAQGLKTSPKTVRRRIEEGKLRAFKVGGQIRIREEDLQAYIEVQLEKGPTS